MSKKQLSKSEIKDLNEKLKVFGVELSKKSKIEIFSEDKIELILIDSIASFFLHHGLFIPTLKFITQNPKLKTVTVDMGAVPFVAKGADVMRPGIRVIDEGIAKGDFVAIVDEKYKRPLAIGEALYSSIELTTITQGRVIKIIHHVGDKIWSMCP